MKAYRLWPNLVIDPWANLYPLVPPPSPKPGNAYSATPNAHTNCTANVLTSAQEADKTSTPSQPNNTALAIPMRYANPVDIANGSSVGTSYGGVNGSAGFMVFPNYADGANAAMKSLGNYAAKGYTIAALINIWAPPSGNPNTLTNFLSAMGMTSTTASGTLLGALTSLQQIQIIAAFAWQEGFKPSGC